MWWNQTGQRQTRDWDPCHYYLGKSVTIGLVHSKKLCPAHRRQNKLQNLVPLAPISHLPHPDPLQASRLFRVKGVNKVGNHRDGGWAGWSVNRVNGWLGSKGLVWPEGWKQMGFTQSGLELELQSNHNVYAMASGWLQKGSLWQRRASSHHL